MRQLLTIITNKFFIVSVAFLLLMLFFDQNDWFTQHEASKELDKMNENIEFLKGEVGRMEVELEQLDQPQQLEKFAREKYHERREGEDVYLILPDSTPAPRK